MRHWTRILLITAALGLLASVPAFAQSATATEDASGSTIAVGQTVNGTLTTAQPSQSYMLQGESGESVTIHLTSDVFDAYLVLEDSTGKSIAENDDADGTNAEISNFSLPSDGTYTIIAESYGQENNTGAETGDYTLSVTAQQSNNIEYSQTIHDQLTTDAMSKDYNFSGQAGDVIVATESSTDSSFDSYLHLLDPTGNELTSNDDNGNSLDSMIGPYTLPSTGTYTLRATTSDGNTTGAFTLTLTKVTVAAADYDQPVPVSFTGSDQVKYFTFQGTSGDVVTITADDSVDGAYDTSLVLNDPNDSQVASDDNGGPGLDPEIYQQLLTSTGTYTVILQAVTSDPGQVTFLIKRGSPPTLDQGTETFSFNSSQSTHAATFTAVAGQAVQLSLHTTNGSGGQPSVTVTQDDSTIASASGDSISDLSIGFTPTSDGQVLVQIDDESGNSITYQVSLSKPSE